MELGIAQGSLSRPGDSRKLENRTRREGYEAEVRVRAQSEAKIAESGVCCA